MLVISGGEQNEEDRKRERGRSGTLAQCMCVTALLGGYADTTHTGQQFLNAETGTFYDLRLFYATPFFLMFGQVSDGINAYGVAAHRHAPEIEQGLGEACGGEVVVNFTPHLMPMSRGILEVTAGTLCSRGGAERGNALDTY